MHRGGMALLYDKLHLTPARYETIIEEEKMYLQQTKEQEFYHAKGSAWFSSNRGCCTLISGCTDISNRLKRHKQSAPLITELAQQECPTEYQSRAAERRARRVCPMNTKQQL